VAELVVVVVVVVVLVVGAVVPLEPHATVSIPAAMAATPIVNGARRQIRARVNANGISLSSQSYDRTARFIPARRRQPPESQVGLSVDLAVSPLN
jgi:hypothetical protein